jgi:hypothetical protein
VLIAHAANMSQRMKSTAATIFSSVVLMV